MPSTTIPCSECNKKTAKIKSNPDQEFVSCTELPNQAHLPPEQKECKIIWKDALT